MSRPIQTNPLGYLGLLGLKNNGQNPAEAIDTAQPMIEMGDMYRLDRRRWSFIDVGVANASIPVGNLAPSQLTLNTLLTPQENEVWYIEGGQFTAFLPAGITVAGMNMIAMHGVLSQPAAWRAISDPLAAQVGGVAVDQEIARRIDGGWWLKPGEFVTVSANAVNIAVQPLGVNVELTFARVPI